jgi:hypothetical protein
LDSADKLRENDVDTIICAELPDKESDPQLFDTISTCNVRATTTDLLL